MTKRNLDIANMEDQEKSKTPLLDKESYIRSILSCVTYDIRGSVEADLRALIESELQSLSQQLAGEKKELVDSLIEVTEILDMMLHIRGVELGPDGPAGKAHALIEKYGA